MSDTAAKQAPARPEERPGGAAGGGQRPMGRPWQRPGMMIGGQGPAEKPKDAKKTIRFLMTYFRPRMGKLTIVFVFAVLARDLHDRRAQTHGARDHQALRRAHVEVHGGYFLHKPMPSMDFNYIGGILLLIVGFYLLAPCSATSSSIRWPAFPKMVYDMRQDVNDKLARLPLKYFDGKTHGEIMSRVTNDIDNISTTLQQSLTQLITSVCTIVGVLVMMLTISPLLTLISLVTLPASLLVTMNITKLSQKSFGAQQKELGELNGHVEEMYTGHVIVKAFGRERESVSQFKAINARLYDAAWKAQFVSGIIMPMMNFINNIGYVVICVVGGIMAARKALKLGDIQAFIQYSRQFTQPIAQTANIANVLQSTIASAERVFEVLDEAEEIPERSTRRPRDARGEVEFRHVRFGYKKDAILMEDMNIKVGPGQTIAIVGPTGAGKPPMVNLLMRFYEISGRSYWSMASIYGIWRRRRAAHHVRHGPPGHLALQRFDTREHRLRPRRGDGG